MDQIDYNLHTSNPTVNPTLHPTCPTYSTHPTRPTHSTPTVPTASTTPPAPTDPYDFRKYDQVWKRVSPHLEPYSESYESASQSTTPEIAPLTSPFNEQNPALDTSHMPIASSTSSMPSTPSVPSIPVPPVPARPTAPTTSAALLPGADQDPCCMGSAAAEMLEVITGFIEAELADRRHYSAFARQAPSYARQRLRELGTDAGSAAQRLMAAYYLITGTCYRPSVDCTRIHIGPWCPALRERYHVEACNGLNYIRAAESTTDPCLRRLLTTLSQESYRHADQLMALLERGMQT